MCAEFVFNAGVKKGYENYAARNESELRLIKDAQETLLRVRGEERERRNDRPELDGTGRHVRDVASNGVM